MNTQVQIKRTTIPAPTSRRISAVLILTAIVIGSSACAGIEPSAQLEASSAQESIAEQAPPQATLEDAARAALVDAWAGKALHDRDRLRVGAILQTDSQFTWLEPRSSKVGHRPVVRLGLHANHAATYIIHPRSGSTGVDRANEQITNQQKRLVDQIDPLHRPIYVLTPSGRILAYSYGAEVAELASVRDERNRAANATRVTGTADLAQRH